MSTYASEREREETERTKTNELNDVKSMLGFLVDLGRTEYEVEACAEKCDLLEYPQLRAEWVDELCLQHKFDCEQIKEETTYTGRKLVRYRMRWDAAKTE
eukprot:TRINITY_DN229_c0_g6_i1.p1 TRINITY_DN229_c0_g6~~TRINITY_DN229_c0_g6_i1.p1  ORF type:complete len:100 (+),score=23.70 TRINITY_DN229_c0_g6_i1:151-450(+)